MYHYINMNVELSYHAIHKYSYIANIIWLMTTQIATLADSSVVTSTEKRASLLGE